jgi:deoxyribodipyrimidine photolyase
MPELAKLPTSALLRPGDAALLASGYPAPIVDTRVGRERVLAAFRAASLADSS